MASVLLSAGVAIGLSLAALVADWPALTRDLCRSVAGPACTPEVYRSVLYEGGVTVLAAVATLGAVVAAWRWGRRVQRSSVQTRAHARTALLVGSVIAGTADGAVMLDDPRPAAYCVAGRPAAIVVTSGALAVLDPPQLHAVLAHERAHLARGHHSLALVTGGLAAAFPGVPLFTRGAGEVAKLAEMSADDAAAKTAGRATLATALLAIATGARFPVTGLTPGNAGRQEGRAVDPSRAIPVAGLAAAAYAVPARVERMLRQPRPAVAAFVAAGLAACSALLVLAPAALVLLVR